MPEAEVATEAAGVGAGVTGLSTARPVPANLLSLYRWRDAREV